VLCIWCLEEREPRRRGEHVVAKSIGGSFTIPRVCVRCDNRLGNVADDPLIEHFGMLVRRASLGLKGQRGTVPDVIASVLSNVATAADDPSFRLDIRASSTNGTFNARVQPHVDIEVQTDGDAVRVAINALRVDARDPDRAEMLFKSTLRKNGVKNDAMLNELWRVTAPRIREVAERRTIEIPYEYRFNGHRAGLIKIAYELAWHWLGDAWLGEATAAEMRRTALAGEDGSQRLIGMVRDASEIKAQALLVRDGDRRIIAALLPYSAGYAVMLRLLDEFEALIVISEDSRGYRHPEKDAIIMDAVARTHVETNFLALFGFADGTTLSS
jgi:HNH endonuclease